MSSILTGGLAEINLAVAALLFWVIWESMRLRNRIVCLRVEPSKLDLRINRHSFEQTDLTYKKIVFENLKSLF